jgi:hypothetical protein
MSRLDDVDEVDEDLKQSVTDSHERIDGGDGLLQFECESESVSVQGNSATHRQPDSSQSWSPGSGVFRASGIIFLAVLMTVMFVAITGL